MDVVEDFSMFNQRRTSRMPRPSRSTIMSALLSPRRSFAFRPPSDMYEQKRGRQSDVSSIATMVIQRPTSPSPVILPPVQPLRPAISLDTHFLQAYKPGKHVIVKYGHNHAPTLDLRRFSDLIVPLPTAPPQISEKGGTRPTTASSERMVNPYSPTDPISRAKSLRVFSLPPARSERMPMSLISSSATRGHLSVRTTVLSDREDRGKFPISATTVSRQSHKSFASHTTDSLAGVEAIAMEFPGVPPPWKYAVSRRESTAEPLVEGDETADYRMGRNDSISADRKLARRGSSVKRKPVPKYEEIAQSLANRSAPAQNQVFVLPPLPSAPVTPNTSSAFSPPPSSRRQSRRSRPHVYGRASRSMSPDSSRVSQTIQNPWMSGNRDIVQESRAELDLAWQRLGRVTQRESIKSVGSVRAERSTPTPSLHTSSHRDSMMPEWHSTDGSDVGEYPRRSLHPLRPTSSAASVISDSPTLGV